MYRKRYTGITSTTTIKIFAFMVRVRVRRKDHTSCLHSQWSCPSSPSNITHCFDQIFRSLHYKFVSWTLGPFFLIGLPSSSWSYTYPATPSKTFGSCTSSLRNSSLWNQGFPSGGTQVIWKFRLVFPLLYQTRVPTLETKEKLSVLMIRV